MPHALVHPIRDLEPPVGVPPARRVRQQARQRRRPRVRHQLVRAAGAQQQLLAAQVSVQQWAKTLLLGLR